MFGYVHQRTNLRTYDVATLAIAPVLEKAPLGTSCQLCVGNFIQIINNILMNYLFQANRFFFPSHIFCSLTRNIKSYTVRSIRIQRSTKFISQLNRYVCIHLINFDTNCYYYYLQKTGVPLMGMQRVQLNLVLRPVSFYKLIENVPETILPVVWLEMVSTKVH